MSLTYCTKFVCANQQRMNIKKHIPNFITLLNLFSGCVALIFATRLNFEMAFLFVCLGIFFDFFDGFFARMFKVSSPLGLQLDSLADMVTSGLTPGYIMYLLLAGAEDADSNFAFLPFLGFIITLGSCYRLANFNIDTRQTDSFIGLPTPANALLIMSLPMIKFDGSLIFLEILINPYILLAITAFSAYILNAEIPLFALKIKKFSFRDNLVQICFLAISLLLLIWLQYGAIPLIIMTYILISVIMNRRQRR